MNTVRQIIPNDKLRRERDYRGWTQSYVAERIGVDPKTVGRWERGESTPKPYARQKLCQLYDKNADELGFLTNETSSMIIYTWPVRRKKRTSCHGILKHRPIAIQRSGCISSGRFNAEPPQVAGGGKRPGIHKLALPQTPLRALASSIESPAEELHLNGDQHGSTDGPLHHARLWPL